MNLEILEKDVDYIIVKIPTESKNQKFIKTEEDIEKSVNELGRILTKDAMEKLDKEEDVLERNGEKITLKKKVNKEYKTPYGSTIVARNIYKSSSGKSYCPIEDEASIIYTATPKLARSISSKYIKMGAVDVVRDFQENHGLKLEESYIQNISYCVGRLYNKMEDEIEYKLPQIDEEIVTVGIGLDGTCSYVGNEGWRETMVGTISLYDKDGNRLHTIYISQAPEYGKGAFKEIFKKEIKDIIKSIPSSVKLIGIADGAKDNWSFLEEFVEIQIIDFYHVSEYLADASKVINLRDKQKQQEWLDSACHRLKNDKNSALVLLDEMKELETKQRVPKKTKENLQRAITYFTNHHHQMNYAEAINNNIPIGSGVTESACKVLVKQRLCISGARWSHLGASCILKLRAVNLTDGRWKQFWEEEVA